MNNPHDWKFAPEQSSRSVLFLCGDVLQGMLVRSVLLNSGIDVRVVSNEMEMRAAVRTFHFDLLMAEWDAEGLDGRTILAKLRSEVQDLSAAPAILVTYNSVSDLARFQLSQQGFRCILQKPIVATSLPKLIAKLIDGEPAACARFVACGDTASGLAWNAVR